MGMEQDGLRSGIGSGRLAAARKILLLFCPSMKREEIMLLKEQHPDLYARAIAIEDNARPRLEKVKGLGRNYAWKDRFGKE